MVRRNARVAKTKKPIFKKWWFWLIVVIVVAGAFGGGSKKNEKADSEKSTPSKTKISKSETPKTEESTSEVSKTEPIPATDETTDNVNDETPYTEIASTELLELANQGFADENEKYQFTATLVKKESWGEDKDFGYRVYVDMGDDNVTDIFTKKSMTKNWKNGMVVQFKVHTRKDLYPNNYNLEIDSAEVISN